MVKNVTVRQSCDKWLVSIQTEREVQNPVPEATSAVGIDMGVARFATLSHDTFYVPLNSFKRHADSLRKAQPIHEPQSQILQQLEESEGPRAAHPYPHRQRASRLSAQDLNRAILDQGWFKFRSQLRL